MIRSYSLSEHDIKQAIALWINEKTPAEPIKFDHTMVSLSVNEPDRPSDCRSISATVTERPVTEDNRRGMLNPYPQR